MATPAPAPQITVLDTGGQYCHLIARRVRELGVYAEVRPSDTPTRELAGRKGVIISGGPASVYDPGSPAVDGTIFSTGQPVLGICYGLQLMAYLLGGAVRKGEKGEFGLATLELNGDSRTPLLEGIRSGEPIWMSHRDVVTDLPCGFEVLGRTDTCAVAIMGDAARRLYGIQFHPEVVHTRQGTELLSNFVFGVCGCTKDWDPKHRVSLIEERVRELAADRNVFFFVSGGVDSTVAYTLCLRALGPHRLRGLYVDTGLMREGETDFVRGVFESLGAGPVSVEDSQEQFLGALAAVRDPERKRTVIGEEFVRVQQRILQEGHLLDGHWILGQGTIYPDTIESGGTKQSAVIKTHHNRVPAIQRLLETNRIIEPLSFFYKDEVRAIGRELGLPEVLLQRQPFPGPGLAIRCLCAEHDAPVEPAEQGYIIPVRSVGVQGDSRSYAPVLGIDQFPAAGSSLDKRATEIINRLAGINRVVACVASREPLGEMHVSSSLLSAERLARLRRADSIVRRFSQKTGFDETIWQFPVVLIPLGSGHRPDSVVLRPIHSVDGMTASAVLMPETELRELADELLALEGIGGVFYDLTHKPPATIEWE